MITYMNQCGKVTFHEADIQKAFLYDSASFSAVKQGQFNTQTTALIDGTSTYDAALSGTQIRWDGRILLYNLEPVLFSEKRLSRVKGWLGDIFNPKISGELHYINANGQYIMRNVRATAPPTFGEYVNGTIAVKFELQSDEWYWEALESRKAVLGVYSGGFTLPFSFPIKFGKYWQYKISIYNDSNYNIYPQVILNAQNTLSTLRNLTTNSYIKMTKPIDQGCRMVIQTSPKIYSAGIYKWENEQWLFSQDASAYLSIDSGDFALIPGTNNISLENGAPGKTPSAEIEYRKIYMEV